MNRPIRSLILFCATLPILAPPVVVPAQQEIPRIAGETRVEVSLVLIDVVVRDRKDRPVPGLSRDDFELLVDRLPVDLDDIETFEEICDPLSLAQSTSGETTPGDPSPTEPSPEAAEALEPPVRTIVVYFDFLQMTMGGRLASLRAARDHLIEQVAPSDRVMILAHKNGLRLVQNFTSDTALLATRLEELMVDRTTLDMEVLEESDRLRQVAGSSTVGGQASIQRSAAAVYAAQEESRARRSLAAIENLLPALEGLKGRKALVLFTDVLRALPGIQYLALARSNAGTEGIAFEEDVQRVTREANAASVSFYTVHASGLDDRTISSFRDAKRPDRFSTSTVGPTYAAARTSLDSALALQTTLATETGGRALQRTNDVGAILDTALQDLSCYYMLGYRSEGRGDDQRHSLIVRLASGPDGKPRRGLSTRHRPYYVDHSAQSRRQRLVRSALDAPELYDDFPVINEAFPLAPEKSGRRVLLKTSLPLDAVSLIPSGESWLDGRIQAHGEVSRDGAVSCGFEHELPLHVPRSDKLPNRLVFETGCVLKPGAYELGVAIVDSATQEIGARRSSLIVPEAESGRGTYVSDLLFWTRGTEDFLVTAGAESIGMRDTMGDSGFVPRSERRIGPRQEAMLSILLCPAAGAAHDPDHPIHVQRALKGEADATVAGFRDLVISEPPDAETGCHQILNSIPPGVLGPGVYVFTIRLGEQDSEPITRSAAFAVK